MYDYGYDYGYSYTDVDTASSILAGFAAMMGIITLISLIVSIIMIVSQWKIYKKAGKKGWEAIVPIYNIIVLLQIVDLPTWYIALFFVPFANIYAMFKMYIELAHKFGKSTGFGVLTVFFSFICLPILAFGKNNVYNGNSNQNTQINNNVNLNQNNNMVNNPNGFTSSNQQPFVFDQNINTEINNIQEPNMNNNLNSQVNPIPQPEMNPAPVFNSTTPIDVSEPVLNTVPNVEPLLQPQAPVGSVDNINNQVNQPSENIPQQENTFTYSIPTPVVNPQQEMPQPVNNITQPNTTPPLNVIPGMGQTPEPTMPYQNNNNQNM